MMRWCFSQSGGEGAPWGAVVLEQTWLTRRRAAMRGRNVCGVGGGNSWCKGPAAGGSRATWDRLTADALAWGGKGQMKQRRWAGPGQAAGGSGAGSRGQTHTLLESSSESISVLERSGGWRLDRRGRVRGEDCCPLLGENRARFLIEAPSHLASCNLSINGDATES